MVQVRILGVALDAAGQHIVLLKPLGEEPSEGRVVPIWIGAQEATSILLAVSGDPAPRPLAHDLMKTLLDTVGARVERIEVTRIENGTFFAEITLVTPSGTRVLDARPSDSVALAVRAASPLFVADEIFAEAGIPADLVESAADETDEDDELDAFKRFLETVDPADFQG